MLTGHEPADDQHVLQPNGLTGQTNRVNTG